MLTQNQSFLSNLRLDRTDALFQRIESVHVSEHPLDKALALLYFIQHSQSDSLQISVECSNRD